MDLQFLQDIAKGACVERGADASYGDLVALADYATSPTDFYLNERNDRAWDDFVNNLWPEESIAWLAKDIPQYLRSTRLNEDHFQNRALYTFGLWHDFATYLAAAGQLKSALVLNAFADHFLQDIFAPGHVMTPRRRFHDAASLAMHDTHNQIGRVFRFSHLESLRRFLIEIEDPLVSDFIGHPDHIRTQFDGLIDGEIRLQGDGQLHTSADQKLVMSLAIARSVADVLESFLYGTAVNSYLEVTWSGHSSASGGRSRVEPKFSLPFGELVAEVGSGPLMTQTIVGLSVGYQAVLGEGQGPPRLLTELHMMVFGTPGSSFLRDGGDQVARRSFPQMGVFLGGSLVGNCISGPCGAGPSLRLLFPIPKLDMQLSVGGGVKYYSRPDEWAWNGGGRLELGLGLFFLGLGVERAQGMVGETLTDAWSLSSGVTLAAPIGRLPLFN